MHDRGEHREDDERPPVESDTTGVGHWISVFVVLSGLWLLAESALVTPVAGAVWSTAVLGGTLVALGAYNYYRCGNEQAGSLGVGAFVALLGLWIVATPFILGTADGTTAVQSRAPFWIDVSVGLFVSALGAYSFYEAHDTALRTPTQRT